MSSNPSASYGLSKSRLTSFEQCPKRLWLSVHRKDLVKPVTGRQVEAGNEAGELARDLVPGGVPIEPPTDLKGALKKTTELLASGYRGPIYEGTFVREGVLVQVDILEPLPDSSWKLAEVKSSTKLKDYHIGDVATQAWVLQATCLVVQSHAVRLINPDFVLQRAGQYDDLFVDRVVDDEIAPIVETRAEVVAHARATLAGPEPQKEMGEHCSKPFKCEFGDYCRRGAPEGPKWPISLLPVTGNRLAKQWADKGKLCLTQLEELELDKPQHRLIHRATVTGTPFHDPRLVQEQTANWSFPRHFLDFETISYAIPRWIGTKPNQSVPFQFSWHTQLRDGTVRAAGFLHKEMSDPRRACAEALLGAVKSFGAEGAVVAYSMSVERGAIRTLADACPDLASDLLAIADRVVDLLPVVKAGFYHANQRGSWSIKKVLECVVPELAYSQLSIGDGLTAQDQWVAAVSPGMADENRSLIFSQLEEYCSRDTEAMVKLLGRLTRNEQL